MVRELSGEAAIVESHELLEHQAGSLMTACWMNAGRVLRLEV